MQLVPSPFMGARLAALVPLVAALFAGCGESDECSTNSDCPPGRLCRLGLCALDPGGDTGGDAFPDIPLDCLVAGPDDLIMTEILADPPSGADIDGNGTPSSTGDEFVEIVNIAARPVALTNVQIEVGSKRVNVGSLCLNPYQTRVLFGSAGLPGLTNSGGTVSLVVDGQVVQSKTYGAEGGRDSSLTLERQLDKTSPWVLHKDIAPTAYSPGTCANGNAFPNCDGVVIPDGEVLGDGEIITSCNTAPAAGDLVINELLADPGDLDANGDGVPNANDDEFVELVNVSSSVLRLDGLVFKDAGTKVFNLPAGLCLAPNQALLIFGKYNGTGNFGDAIVLSGNNLSLNNDADTITIQDASATVIAQASYSANLANADQSIVRETDLNGSASFVRHSLAPNANGARMSPGFCQGGASFPDCDQVIQPDVIGDSEVLNDSETVASCSTKPAVGDLVINELLADPGDLDANGDGVPNGTDDEFIEVVNISSSVLNLDGLVYKDAGTKVLNLPTGLCLAPNQALIIFGKYTGTGNFGDSIVVHGNNISLNNDADTVTLLDASSTVLAQASYSGNIANADQSIVRETDLAGSGSFVRHSLAANSGGSRMSPGTCQNGNAFPDCSSPVEPTDTTDSTDTADTTDTVDTDVGPSCGPLASAADIVVNEVLMDPPNTFDSNGDGIAETTQDEFVEIINVGGAPVRLFGLKIADASSDRYTFGEVCLGVNEAVVVFGKGAKHFSLGGVIVLDTATHSLNLNNGGETVTLRYSMAAGDTLATHTFAEAVDQSWTRSPDTTGGFVQHLSVTPGIAATPGACLGGATFPGCLAQ